MTDFADIALPPRPRVGIHARTLDPGWIHDGDFVLERRADGTCVCRMRPGSPGYLKDWWQEVPCP